LCLSIQHLLLRVNAVLAAMSAQEVDVFVFGPTGLLGREKPVLRRGVSSKDNVLALK
jgi:hypothetical protein